MKDKKTALEKAARPGFFIGIPAALAVVFLYAACTTPVDFEDERVRIEVTGSISENTTWTTGNDYLVKGTVTVEENALLTIQPDVRVIFESDSIGNWGKLLIYGGIHADGGDSTTVILFEAVSTSDGFGVEIQETGMTVLIRYCEFRQLLYGLRFYRQDVHIRNCIFKSCKQGLSITRGESLSVKYSSFIDNEYGIKTYACPEISDSTIKITRNTFVDNFNTAIELNNQSNGYVTDNSILGGKNGFSCFDKSKADLMNNNFENEKVSVFFGGLYPIAKASGNIIRNNFFSGQIAIRIFKSDVKVNYNNIFNYSVIKLRIEQYGIFMDIDAKNNWWGVVDTTQINQMITDVHDNETYNNGTVHYIPFELNEISDCGVRAN